MSSTRPPARRHLLHHYTTAALEALAPSRSIPEAAILAELRRRDASRSADGHGSAGCADSSLLAWGSALLTGEAAR